VKTVIIYRDVLLPSTQTFVASQAQAIKHFQVQYVGLETVSNGYPIRSRPIVLVRGHSLASRVSKKLYKLTGRSSRFVRDVASTKPSLIHAHFVMDGIHALPLASALAIPLIVTLHQHIPTSRGRALPTASTDGLTYLARRRSLWQGVSRFICVSEFVRDRAREIGYPEEKLLVHYIGIDRERFNPSSLSPTESHLVLFVGRFVEKKGAEDLIRAMSIVQQEDPAARLILIGDGPLRSELESLAGELHVRTEFLGEQTGTVIRDWFQRARVLCAPSVTAKDGDTEGLPMVVCEAQAMGLPVVSTLHAGIPEAVKHGETGFLVPEGDVKLLAKYLLCLIEDDNLWQQCSRRAVQRVRERFDLKHQTLELEHIYSSILP
jgi:colanic acid/amylovoran biosynthesis glycosyltransferase